MAIDSIKRRVARLEEKASVQDHQELARVAALIAAGAYYDELTAEEKDLYCKYKQVERAIFEEVEDAVTGTLHQPLERNTRGTMTAAGREKIIQEIEAMIEDTIESENER